MRLSHPGKATLTGVAVSVFLAAATAHAQAQAGDDGGARRLTVGTSGDYLARMDSNRDGRVSLPEFQAWMGYAFERMDVGRDGLVEPHELPGGRGRAIALAEHRARLATTFARQDRDRDGFLDARELAAPPQ